MQEPNSRVLGTLTLAMITVAAVVSLRNLSLLAELGFSAIFFLIVAALIFFIPIALVTAELAATWPRAGGCYAWVGEAYGKPLAFISLWLSWMASVASFPAVLAFTAIMFAHMLAPIFPNLEHCTYFILLIMLVVFWGSTLTNFFGIEVSGFISSAGVIAGTIIPGALIIIMGLWWVASGKPTHIPVHVESLVPDFKLDNLTLFAGVLLSLAGVELAAFHIRETKNPKKSYPRALLISIILTLAIYIFATLAITVVVPQKDLSLGSGLIQAFYVFFTKVGMGWIVPLIALFLFVGAIAGINAWVAGPAKGLLIVAQDGFLPTWLQRVNKHGVPTALLTSQAVVVSILAMLFLYIQDSSASIWFMNALASQFTVLQYGLVFLAALKLRSSQPLVLRAFEVPALPLVAGLGLVACAFSFLIVYAPHAKLVSIDFTTYCLLLISSLLLLILPCLILIKFRHRSTTAKFTSKNY